MSFRPFFAHETMTPIRDSLVLNPWGNNPVPPPVSQEVLLTLAIVFRPLINVDADQRVIQMLELDQTPTYQHDLDSTYLHDLHLT